MKSFLKKGTVFFLMVMIVLSAVGCNGAPDYIRPDYSGMSSTTGSTTTTTTKGDKGEEFTVSIQSNIYGAFEFTGETEQTVSAETPFEEVGISANIGYRYSHYEIDGVEYTDEVISLGEVKKDTVITVYAEYATDELPIINIEAEGEITSKEDYVNMTFSMTNCEDELIDVTGGIRLRGNSTRRYDKKPYRIKFDKKQSLFGLDKAKSWVLLAEYIDPSALHNFTAFSLADAMDGLSFTPTPYKVNVYLNGEFIGLYTLCEQIQENEGRIGIEEDITADMTELKDFNFFICVDKSVIEDAASVEGETYFYLEEYDRYIELKYPEKDQFVSEEQFEKFFNDLKAYVKYLFDIFTNKDAEAIKSEVNVNSLVDYLIVDQIMGEQDHAYKSFNMYFTHTSDNADENNKLNFGPIWDYDWSLRTSWTGLPNQDYTVSSTVGYSNVFFKAMANTPEFYEIVKERYTAYMSDALGNYIAELDDIVAGIEESLVLNAERWYGDFDENMTNDNIEFLGRYLEARKELLDGLWLK